MKFIFIVTLVVSFESIASDCTSQATNLSLGLKLISALRHQLYGDHLQSIEDSKSSAEICSANIYKQEWTDNKNAKLKLTRVIQNDLKNKKKTEPGYFADFDGSHDAKFLDEAEICQIVDKQIKKETDCQTVNESDLKNLARTNFLNMSYEEACKKMIPKVRENHKNRAQCENQDNVDDKAVERDPPGEEIAPDDDIERPVVQTTKPKSRSEIRDERPAKVNTKSNRSGVTSQ